MFKSVKPKRIQKTKAIIPSYIPSEYHHLLSHPEYGPLVKFHYKVCHDYGLNCPMIIDDKQKKSCHYSPKNRHIVYSSELAESWLTSGHDYVFSEEIYNRHGYSRFDKGVFVLYAVCLHEIAHAIVHNLKNETHNILAYSSKQQWNLAVHGQTWRDSFDELFTLYPWSENKNLFLFNRS